MRGWWRRMRRRLGRALTADIRDDLLAEIRGARAASLYATLPDRVLTIHRSNRAVKFWLPDGPVDFNQRRLLETTDFQESNVLDYTSAHFNLTGKCVVDAGANMGNHALYYAMICEAASVVAFEPNPRARAILDRNIVLNGLSQVRVEPVALAGQALRLSEAPSPANHIGAVRYAADSSGAVEARTLDSFAMPAIDFLKIDVEGMAADVLSGAQDSLARLRPPVMIEMHPEELAQCEALFAALGYVRTKAFAHHNYIYEHRAQ